MPKSHGKQTYSQILKLQSRAIILLIDLLTRSHCPNDPNNLPRFERLWLHEPRTEADSATCRHLNRVKNAMGLVFPHPLRMTKERRQLTVFTMMMAACQARVPPQGATVDGTRALIKKTFRPKNGYLCQARVPPQGATVDGTRANPDQKNFSSKKRLPVLLPGRRKRG